MGKINYPVWQQCLRILKIVPRLLIGLLGITPSWRLSDMRHLTARAVRLEIKAFRFASLSQRIGIDHRVCARDLSSIGVACIKSLSPCHEFLAMLSTMNLGFQGYSA